MAKDIFHDTVKVALQKDGWTITHDPYEIAVGGVEMYIDLGAEQLISAERDGSKIAVEIKIFLGLSLISEFHTAHGQYIDYLYALSEKDPERVLYLAVPFKIYADFFSLQFIQTAVRRSQLRLVIYDPDREEITLWQ
ncbi:MAG: XisH family protein [Hormoscilla sp. GM102CHS1]|nr:XisH family protein [Hormoscilla sp. GM102CHS1]